ncbi:hypothetical protein [Agrobacterium sp. NPDC090283]|uniref:hypothetical protein n=1 Tax=Agrobacterium sp. NPDC090283 TaxID=3363920 RepID=UPI00383A273E
MALLDSIMVRQKAAASAGDVDAFYAADEDMHAGIAVASGIRSRGRLHSMKTCN